MQRQVFNKPGDPKSVLQNGARALGRVAKRSIAQAGYAVLGGVRVASAPLAIAWRRRRVQALKEMAETELHAFDRPAWVGADTFAWRRNLEVRLARGPAELKASQRLRYEVFYEEMSARPDARMARARRDFDKFDPYCDHLLVVDHDCIDPLKDKRGRMAPPEAVVGSYRLLRQDVAEQHGGFYTQDEFDIGSLIRFVGPTVSFLELGRSCVLKPYRGKPTLELLWQGIAKYISRHRCDVLIGCASLEGTDPDALALPLSFLYHHFQAPRDWPTAWHVRPHASRYVEMNRMPIEAVDMKAALRALPPLIKGYIRAGAFIGEGAVIDHQFGTTDVLILFPTARMTERYGERFSVPHMVLPEAAMSGAASEKIS
jgi:putative hemolysin